jgi:tetratricopeptide (TPR) repeat protein
VAELEPVAWLLAGIVVGTNTGRGWARSRRALVAAGLAALAALAVLAAGTLDVAADHRARTLGSGGTGPRPTALRPDAIRYYLAEARAGQPDAARKALERALDLWPRDPIVRLEHARLLLEEARGTGSTATLAQARAELERLSRDDPRNAAVLLRLGVARALAKDAAGAERAWLRAERLAPRSGAAAVNLAIAYAQAGDWPKARAAAQRALALDPANEVATQILNTNGT